MAVTTAYTKNLTVPTVQAAEWTGHEVKKHHNLIENGALIVGCTLTGTEGLALGYEAFEAYRGARAGEEAIKVAEGIARSRVRRNIGTVAGLLEVVGVNGSWARHHL